VIEPQVSAFSGDTLTLRAFSDLQRFFDSINHSPSVMMMGGLYNIIDNLTLQLHGSLDPNYYICSLEPGIGKTSAIKAWINNYLKRAGEYSNKGVVLFFDRHAEIESFLNDCNFPLPEDSYGVLVGDSEVGRVLNARGVGKDNIGNALVLFTTKQQVIRRAYTTGSFNAVSAFHYQGKPRAVRCWDESMIAGRDLTTNASDILELVGTVERRGEMELGSQLRCLAMALYDCADSELIDIPDFDMELKSSFKWETNNMRATAETLDMLAGRVAEVKVAGKGRVALDCIESLPSDLQPCAVTDASARYRGTYTLYEKYQGGIIKLSPEDSCKKFDPLTTYVMHRSTSKATYSNPKEIDKVAADTLQVIMSRPREEFLVVVTVANFKRMSTAILGKLQKVERGRVKFLTWGRHTATNDFKDIPNVIVTSLLYYRPCDYVAGMRAAAVLPASEGFIPKECFKEFQRGEIAHHLLQAANRGKMRKCIGSMCPEARLWIMAAKAIGVEGIIEEVFPGCTIKVWESVAPKEIGGIREQLTAHILADLQTGTLNLPWASVRKAFGIKAQSNFRKLYLNDGTFRSLCEAAGILIDTGRFCFSLNPFR
jgi:hypothetical protein